MDAMFTGFAMLFAFVVCHAATIEMIIRTDDLSEDHGADYTKDHDRNYVGELPEDYNLDISNDYNSKLPEFDYTSQPEVDYTNLPEMDYMNPHEVDYANMHEMDYTEMPDIFNTDQPDEYSIKMTGDEDADMSKDLNVDSLVDTDMSEDYSTDCSKDHGVGYKPDLTLDEDPSQIPPGSLDIDGNEFDQCRVTKTLRVNNGGKWGLWGEASFCPAGSYAAGYDMKIEPKQHLGDDTSLNGIKIICKNLTGQFTGEAASSVGPWGTWVGRTYCKERHVDSTDYLASFSLQVEESQGKLVDDTAANYVKFKCRGKCNSLDYTLVKPPGHGLWGKWGNWSPSCPINTAVCGIKTKVEMKQYGWDDTALNDAIFYCCK